jgi:hypothetical protein
MPPSTAPLLRSLKSVINHEAEGGGGVTDHAPEGDLPVTAQSQTTPSESAEGAPHHAPEGKPRTYEEIADQWLKENPNVMLGGTAIRPSPELMQAVEFSKLATQVQQLERRVADLERTSGTLE